MAQSCNCPPSPLLTSGWLQCVKGVLSGMSVGLKGSVKVGLRCQCSRGATPFLHLVLSLGERRQPEATLGVGCELKQVAMIVCLAVDGRKGGNVKKRRSSKGESVCVRACFGTSW